MGWFFENLDKIGMVLGAIDIVLGSLPDKIIRWPGIMLSIGHQLHQYGKEQKELLK